MFEKLIEYKEMREAIVRVRELHRPFMFDFSSNVFCKICRYKDADGEEYLSPYPCITIQALDGEQ